MLILKTRGGNSPADGGLWRLNSKAMPRSSEDNLGSREYVLEVFFPWEGEGLYWLVGGISVWEALCTLLAVVLYNCTLVCVMNSWPKAV